MGRKLFVEVLGAQNLMPKDGQGSASAYCIVEYDGQRRKTKVKTKDLNPVWNERFDFPVTDPSNMDLGILEIAIYNEKKNAKKDGFLGRVQVLGSSFLKQGEGGVLSYPLEKRNMFSHIKGELRLKVWYVEDGKNNQNLKKDEGKKEDNKGEKHDGNVTDGNVHQTNKEDGKKDPGGKKALLVQPTVLSPGEYALKETSPVIGKINEKNMSYDLVEKMNYLFVRVVKGRNVGKDGAEPFVVIKFGEGVHAKKKAFRQDKMYIWDEVFAFGNDKIHGPTLEVIVSEDEKGSKDFGAVILELSEITARTPDSPLAPQWYCLEDRKTRVRKDGAEIMLAVWWGSQSDEAFAQSWQSDTGGFSHTRSKVYLSPKMWYLRLNIIEAQDLVFSDKGRSPELTVKAQLGFQVVKSKVASNRGTSPFWNQDLVLVAAEPFDEQLILVIEDRLGPNKEEILGMVRLNMNAVPRRLDGKEVPSSWCGLEKNNEKAFRGRIHLRVCFDGGYHVMDESTNHISDLRPTAKPLWRNPLGVLELGIKSGKGFLPMKTKDGRGTTDAYCVAKYGPKWVRTRTVVDSLSPRWNEQYTWEVYDPCTVITVGVFDNCHLQNTVAEKAGGPKDIRIGKVRIRLSTLESDRIYSNTYPLLLLQPSGVKKMGEIELAVRFSSASTLNILQVYFMPPLPKMHYVHPIHVNEQEMLRNAAIRIVSQRLARAEPPLRQEIVHYMLDTDSNMFSMRRSKVNYYRMSDIFSGVAAVLKWSSEICKWRNPITTVLVHILFTILVFFPQLILPTMFMYMFLFGVWRYRFRPRTPPYMDAKLSMAEFVDAEELDEEFDSMPTSKPPDVVKRRYEKLRIVASRLQTVLGDLAAQGERLQALLSWRDTRATTIFMLFCVVAAILLYVIPFRLVALVTGLYILRHPYFRDKMPSVPLNFFRRLPSLADRIL